MSDHLRALADAEPLPFWLDAPRRPIALPALVNREDCDLAIVGGGYSGLWTALLAKERDPARDVVLIESNAVGWAASGRRNGGFCAASLTHGLGNGLARWPDEMQALQRLGEDNLRQIETHGDHPPRHRLLLRATRRTGRSHRAVPGRGAARGSPR